MIAHQIRGGSWVLADQQTRQAVRGHNGPLERWKFRERVGKSCASDSECWKILLTSNLHPVGGRIEKDDFDVLPGPAFDRLR